MSFADAEIKIVRWGEARKIVQNSNVRAQARKTLEEAGELIEAASAMMEAEAAGNTEAVHHWREKYRDAIGDVGVTLLMGCATADVDFVECLQQAYEEIKDRKGWLRPDGVFVKESGQNV
jgi:NTP pyrophosphatase (non-canonical NTP hydrolase)